MNAVRLCLAEASFYERPVKLRLPFRFGVVTLTEAPQVFVRARVRLADGREGEGISAELLVPKWFDKSPQLSNDDNFNQLRRSLAIAKRYMIAAGSDTPFGLSAVTEKPQRAECEQAGLNGLIASFGIALLERAVIDALGRLEKQPAATLVRDNRLGIDARLTPDLASFELSRFLSGLMPAPSIHVRHTVGLLDALTRSETQGKRLDDGLPESLERTLVGKARRVIDRRPRG